MTKRFLYPPVIEEDDDRQWRYVYFVSYQAKFRDDGSHAFGRCDITRSKTVTGIDDVESMERAIVANDPRLESCVVINYQLMNTYEH